MAAGWRTKLFGLLRRSEGGIEAAAAPDLPVFDLDHDHGVDPHGLTDLLGGKGAGLAAMRRQLQLPVPPGFVLATPLCHRCLQHGWPDGLDAAIAARLAAVERATGRRFGDRRRPLLLSVRSGAPVSMPGMMDTVLNLGINAEIAASLGEQSGDERFGLDTWLRFARMYAAIVLDVSADTLGNAPPHGAAADLLRTAIADVHHACRARGTPIPDDPPMQLRAAIEAVFRSWHSRRARVYRQRERIADALGTAVVVQAMVFGNMDDASGTGVAFSRNPSTGANEPCGDFLRRAQGEAVVAGTHRTEGLAAMARHLPEAHGELLAILRRLERHHADLCDIEFTVQSGRLYILQARPGKRSAMAAVRLAVALAEDPVIGLTRADAVRRIGREQVQQLQSCCRVKAGAVPAAAGVAASPGVSAGVIVTDPDRAAELAATGTPVILVRATTAPQDVYGMVAAAGIVTATGGMLSHAALVARSWNIPAVCGVAALEIGPPLRLAGARLAEGALITIDGDRGLVYRGDLREAGGGEPAELGILRRWAAELGMNFAGEAVSAPAAAPVRESVTPVALLRALQLCGFASAEQLAASLIAAAEQIDIALDNLPAGLVAAAPRGLHLTPSGRAWLATALAEERRQVDPAPAADCYDAFTRHDAAFKQVVTDWQMRLVNGALCPNDHTDAAYDDAVLARFAALHAAAGALLVRLAALAPRLRRYGDRLAAAAAAVAAGDASMIASPLKQSYHTIWFELHEELIGLAGRDRAGEEQKQARP